MRGGLGVGARVGRATGVPAPRMGVLSEDAFRYYANMPTCTLCHMRRISRLLLGRLRRTSFAQGPRCFETPAAPGGGTPARTGRLAAIHGACSSRERTADVQLPCFNAMAQHHLYPLGAALGSVSRRRLQPYPSVSARSHPHRARRDEGSPARCGAASTCCSAISGPGRRTPAAQSMANETHHGSRGKSEISKITPRSGQIGIAKVADIATVDECGKGDGIASTGKGGATLPVPCVCATGDIAANLLCALGRWLFV